MKKKLSRVLIMTGLTLCIGTTNVMANSTYFTSSYNYEFDTGVDYSKELGKPTPTEYVKANEEDMNVRRNKDASLLPPSYGVFSGEIDTERSNPYITPDSKTVSRETTGTESAYVVSTDNTTGNSNVTVSQTNSNNNYQDPWKGNTTNTEPLYYSDNSIGRLYIPEINVDVKVYEGETLENMKIGAAHFSSTSAWTGNVGVAAHNSGSSGYFKNLTRLEKGDIVKYTTKYGTRTYEVTSMHKIYDDDYSLLGYSSQNTITLITCEKGVSNQRYVVVATEK